MKNLHHIRYYEGKRYDPDEFKNRGWRGWWIRFLNNLRFRVECQVIKNVLILHASKFGDLIDLNAVIETFESDVKPRKSHFTAQRQRFLMPSVTGSVEQHLYEMRDKRRSQNLREVTAHMVSRYAAEPRTRRYAFSRNYRVMMEATAPEQETRHGQEIESDESAARRESSRPSYGRSGKVRPIHPEYAASILPLDSPDEADDPEIVQERLRASRYARSSAAQAVA